MSSHLSTTPSGRRRAGRTLHAEDETLNLIAKEAEARLAQKRAARIEAREIRMRELERQQREAGEKEKEKDNEDRGSSSFSSSWGASYGSSRTILSRRSSDDSTTNSELSSKELKDALAEMSEKYRQAMVQNAQLDNERTQLNYRVELLKDTIEEQEEDFHRLKKKYKEKWDEVERRKRLHDTLMKKHEDLQEALRQRDELIQEQGLVLIGGNGVIQDEYDDDDIVDRKQYALVTPQAAQVLQTAGDGPLDVRIKNLAEEKQDLYDEVQRLKTELEEVRRNGEASVNNNKSSMHAENGAADMQLLELQREASKQISEYKFKLQKAEQEIGALQSNVSRLETQLQRYKATSDVLEKSEDEMRAEKRKLQRDLRACLDRIEEMEMTNAHLEKRLERMRATRTAQNSQT